MDKPASETLYAGTLNKVPMPDCRNRTIQPGEKVRLRWPHPHADRVGVYQGVERTAAGWGCLVRFDDDDGCFVFESSMWEKAGQR